MTALSNSQPRSPRRGTAAAAAALVASVFALLASGLPVPAYGAPIRAISLETKNSHTRILVNVDQGVNARFKDTGKGFEITLPGLALADLGAPLGEEGKWAQQYESLADDRVSQLTLSETADSVKITGAWKFPSGKQALAKPEMEHFDYREKSPPRYVVDLWVKPGPTLAESQVRAKKAVQKKVIDQAEADTKARVAKRLARDAAKAEAEDIKRFCRYPLSEDTDVFLKFQPVHDKVDFSRWISATTPDMDFPYYEPTGKERDAQYVRLALSLYRKGEFGLAIRTLDFFDAEHPKSTFRREMRFLRANVLIKMGYEQQADPILTALMFEGRESPVALHCGMYRAARQVKTGNYLAALEAFLWLSERYPDHRLAWVFHFGAAESLYALRQTERAAKEYAWMIENAPDKKAKSEAALRLGDLYMNRFQYEQALAAYYEGSQLFPEQAKSFPPLAINRAETLYGLGQLDRAKDAFTDFLKRFPSHPSGWRATFRLGEIAARAKPLTAQTLAASRKLYYETINRFPMSPGSTLARLRLLPCGDHAGFDLAAAERFFFGEAQEFNGGGQVSLQRYQDLVSLTHVRSMLSLADPLDAVDVTIEELQYTSDRDVKALIAGILAQQFRKTALGLLAEGKKYQALKFFREKAQYLPKNDVSVDPDYLIKLSQAASDLGLGKLAPDLAADFSARQTRMPAAEADKTDLEHVLKASERAYAQAKAMWIAAGGATGAKLGDAALAQIEDKLSGVTEESTFFSQRETLQALIDDRQGDASGALAHALRAQLVAPAAKDGSRDLALDAWLASLARKAGDYKVALELYGRLEHALKGRKPAQAARADESTKLGVPPAPTVERVLLSMGEVLETTKDWGAAVATYERAVKAGMGGNQAVYGFANAMLESGGDRAKAYDTLEKLAGPKPPPGQTEDFWKRLARERLANEQSRQAISNAKEGIL